MKARTSRTLPAMLFAGLASLALGLGALPAIASGGGAITTVAGGPGRGLARNVAQSPLAVATGPDGSVYLASGVVRSLSDASTWEKVVAGGGDQGLANGIPAGRLALDAGGVAVGAAGNVIVADVSANRVIVVAATSGTFYGQAMTAGHVYVVAGNGTRGYTGDSGPAAAAELDLPHGVAADAQGNLVIADYYNNAIRVVAATSGTFYGQAMTAGDIYTVAGNGTRGFSGDGGPGTAAELYFPQAVAVDAMGNLVIADTSNSRIRVLAATSGTFYGQAMTADDIYTVAGSSTEGYAGDGGPATSAKLAFPAGVAIDAAGNLVIADTANNRIRVVAAASGTFYGQAMAGGDIYTVAGDGSRGYLGDGGPATSAKVREPDDVAVDRSGNLVIADTGNSRVRLLAAAAGTFYGHPRTAGDIYTIAGNGLQLSGNGRKVLDAELALHPDVFRDFSAIQTSGLAVSASGNYAIYDSAEIRMVAVASGTFFGQAMTAGHIYDLAGNGHPGFSGDGGPGTSATVRDGGGLAFDQSGNLIIADTENHVVRVVAAASGTFYGQAMTTGHIYTVVGDGDDGFSGNTGPAISAELGDPGAVAVDSSGNLVISDTLIGDYGQVRVVAATTGTFYGQAMTAGHIYGVAGSLARHTTSADGAPAASVAVLSPEGIAVDGAGNLVIAESLLGGKIRVVAATTGTFYGTAMHAGDIYTIATADVPLGVAIDRSGNVIIASYFGNEVQVLADTTGTFYGQAMVAGKTYRVARGGGEFPGIDGPEAVAVDAGGDILFTDDGTGRIRAISP